MQEVKNAVDQAQREITNRFDFKGTNSSIELDEKGLGLTLETASEDRMFALKQVLEEKLVKRKVSLKCLEEGKIEDAAAGRARLKIDLKQGVSQDMAKKINVFIKEMKLKGVQSSTQGDQVRVTAKKRDALQDVISALKETDLDLPLQFQNFRD